MAWAGLALLQGMGAIGAATVANLFVVEAHPQDEWEQRIAWLQTFYGGGQVCGLFIAGILTRWPLHIGLFAAAGLSALAALLGWATMRTPRDLLLPKPILLHPPQPSEWPASSPQHLCHHLTVRALRQGWQSVYSPLTLFLSCWLLAFAGSWVFFSQSPVLMLQTYGVSPWLLASGSAVAHGLGLALYVPAGLWADREGPRRVLQVALGVRLLAFFSLYSLGYTAFDGQGWIALLCVIGVVLSWSLLSVSGTALTARLSQMDEGEGMGRFNATTAFAGVTGAALGGWVVEHWGYHTSLALPVIGVGLGLILSVALPPVKRCRSCRSGGGSKVTGEGVHDATDNTS
jgi:predicted MFS family arabinose efflux permease